MGEREESNKSKLSLKGDHSTIENYPGSTHPGAEHGPMCGSLMMGMMSGMLDRLRLSQSTDKKYTEH
jgi:hypothetical protein